ncbi:MAG TPA: hypothetical protein VFO19_16455, partial [Vicinamibacterales bacterium]|nr:hypothetical protein [Vicinamibacterales bacterium]
MIYRGRVFTIEVGRVRLPHGIETTMEVVRHRGSVVLIPQPTPATVILIRQYRPVIGRWIWELPAGSLEAGEAIGLAAWRLVDRGDVLDMKTVVGLELISRRG